MTTEPSVGLWLIPALAGTTSRSTRGSAWPPAHPRAGGDDGRQRRSVGPTGGSSPRWRGRLKCDGGRVERGGLIPALAGTTAARSADCISARAHPRAGGDDPITIPIVIMKSGSSPRWRGRRGLAGEPHTCCGLIPALAGTTRRLRRRRASRRAHPRAGGDDPICSSQKASTTGSSPRWRGRLCEGAGRHPHHGLIPALAGTTRTPPGTTAPPRAHPRAGGDDQVSQMGVRSRSGSSPRWRGRHGGRVPPGVRDRLIPALAGTTPPLPYRAFPRTAHPRAGGDDNSSYHGQYFTMGSSPRWRGRLRSNGKEWLPAWAHPRAGGDDWPIFGQPCKVTGSSPRWRGRHLLARVNA